MSKFLYPIYKLNIESYKKWWLYHKKAGGSGILSEILQGFSFNLENTLNRKFKLFEIEGNSVQDGSPSPDNEVPIESAGDNIQLWGGFTFERSASGMGSINQKIINKNWNTSPLQDGSLTNGLPDTNYETCRTTNFIDIKPSTNYAFSINGTLNRVVVSMYDKDKNFIATDGAGGYASSNGLFTTYANAYYIKYRAYNADKQLFLNGNIQLEEGSTATPYVEHEEQDYSIFVQQPFRNIGEVRDCFVEKSDGWYERHYIGEKILDGTENWEIYNTHIYLYDDTFKASVESNDYVPNYKCNYFIPDSLFNANTSPNGKILQNVWGALAKHKGIAFNSQDTFRDVATLKTWLSTHNVVVQYELVEPLDLPCTETQIQQLKNKPSTYKDFTIIQSQDETPAYLKIQYWKEVQS